MLRGVVELRSYQVRIGRDGDPEVRYKPELLVGPSARIIHVCILGDFNATSGSLRFNEIRDMLHENNVSIRDTDIKPDKTFTHVNNSRQTF